MPVSQPPAIEDAVATALASLEALIEHARSVAHGFRTVATVEADRCLSVLVHGTRTLVTLEAMLAAVAASAGDGQARPPRPRRTRPVEIALVQVTTAQLSGDWRALAEAIDRRLVPALQLWRQGFQAFIQHTPEDPGGLPA
jgi:hypothetical protein